MTTEKKLINEILNQIGEEKFTMILCCGRGGLVPSAYLAHKLGIETVHHLTTASNATPEIFRTAGLNNKVLIVDDISDTGETFLALVENITIDYKVAALYERYSTKFKCDFVGEYLNHGEWIDFDWEIKDENN